jgi:hypothetical protein
MKNTLTRELKSHPKLPLNRIQASFLPFPLGSNTYVPILGFYLDNISFTYILDGDHLTTFIDNCIWLHAFLIGLLVASNIVPLDSESLALKPTARGTVACKATGGSIRVVKEARVASAAVTVEGLATTRNSKVSSTLLK